MKNLIAISLIILIVGNAYGQEFPVDRYNSSDVTYLGMDFTMGKLINQLAFTDPTNLANKYVFAWNHIVLSEPSKYNLSSYFLKPDIEINLDLTDKFNQDIDPQELVQNNSYKLSADDVISDVKKYTSEKSNGLGILMYVEYFNKELLTATYWFTIIDLANGDVLFIKKYSGKPRGFGVKNYWLGAFRSSLKNINKSLSKMIY